MLKKKNEGIPQIHERVVVLEKDGYSADILPVIAIDHERIATADHSIPLEDVREYITPEGRIFVLHAPEWYVQETKHLARVEMSEIVGQMVQFQKPGAAKSEPGLFMRLLPWVIAGAAILFYFMKK